MSEIKRREKKNSEPMIDKKCHKKKIELSFKKSNQKLDAKFKKISQNIFVHFKAYPDFYCVILLYFACYY